MAQLTTRALSLLTDPKHTRWIAPCLVLVEAALCTAIILKVPYTEIDWSTYMIQVSQFLPPEPSFEYADLEGPTGPCVYPALHVYIHAVLYYVTGNGEDIRLAQGIYAGVYLLTLALVLACYVRVGAPPWVLAALVCSKRLHSVFVLRMFNDCWAVLFFWAAVYAGMRRRWVAMTVCWALGLGVKMTVLLAAPAVGVLLVQATGFRHAVVMGGLVVAIQVGIAAPFMVWGSTVDYWTQAFEFTRQFLYKWTVNWRMVDEETFLSSRFSLTLLSLHFSALLAFLEFRWVQPSAGDIVGFLDTYLVQNGRSAAFQEQVRKRITPMFVMDTMLASIVIGMVCARSLHYQFFAYLAWCSPYLLWRLELGPLFVFANLVAQELAWLTYPSTVLSSTVVVGQLALQTACAFFASPALSIIVKDQAKKKS